MIREISSTVILCLIPSIFNAGPLHDAAKDGNAEVVVLLLKSGADIDEVDFLLGSPLHIAAVSGNDRVIDVLVKSGADVDVVEYAKSATPLHWAAVGGHLNAAERLIAAGADLDARTDRGDTPLLVALGSGNAEVANALIEAGADILAQNQSGHTTIQLAGRAEEWALVNLLSDRGARPNDPVPVTPFLANADLERGAFLWLQANCVQCHGSPSRSVGDDGFEKGPPLKNVIGRDVAAVDNYPYSAALLREEGIWTYEKLNRFLADPAAFWPGTAMIYTSSSQKMGLSEVTDRAALIAYLRQNAEPVPPLPGDSP